MDVMMIVEVAYRGLCRPLADSYRLISDSFIAFRINRPWTLSIPPESLAHEASRCEPISVTHVQHTRRGDLQFSMAVNRTGYHSIRSFYDYYCYVMHAGSACDHCFILQQSRDHWSLPLSSFNFDSSFWHNCYRIFFPL